MKTPLKNWKVFINGILTITVMVPTTWPTSVAQATEVEAPNAEFVTPKDTSFYDSLDTSNCTIGFDQQLNNFIANFNKKYPQEEVQIQQIHQIIGKTTSVESAAQAYDDPDLQLQALQLVNFIYEKCTDEDEAAFTGVIYKIMATQMTLFQDENKVVDAYRPMQMLLTVIGSKFFTSDLMSERQKNRDSLFHNTIEWMPWVALASTLGTVAFYKRNPLKIWKDAAANAVKRKLGKKIFNSRSSEEEIFRNEAMAWYKTHHVDGVVTQEGLVPRNTKLLPSPRNNAMPVDEGGHAFTRQVKKENLPKRKSYNYDQKPNQPYSPTSGLPGNAFKVAPGDSKSALYKRLKATISGKPTQPTAAPTELNSATQTKTFSAGLSQKVAQLGQEVHHAFKTGKAWLAMMLYGSGFVAAGYSRQWLYQNDHFKQLPLDMDAKFDEQNFMLALSVHCKAQELNRTIVSRNYHSADKYKAIEDAKNINSLAVAYSLIIRPDQILKDAKSPVSTPAAWTFGGHVPAGIQWSEKTGQAISSYNSTVDCPTKIGLAKDKIAPNNEDSKKLIDNAATFYVNHLPSEKLSHVISDTDKIIKNISVGVVQKIKAKNNELRSSLDHQVQLQNQDAQAMSDFDFLVQRFTQAYNENQNILQQNLQELHNNLLQLRPNGDYRVVEKVVEKANSLSPHEFNRWLMQLFWRFVKYPQERVAIYVMWSYLANKNYAVKQAVNQIVKVQTNADQEIDPETSTSEENTVQQRMNNAALILSLVHGDALLQPAHIEIPLFTVPQTNKKWEWSVRVIRSIEGQRGYLNDAQQDLNLEWSRAPLVELAAQEMSGKSSDVQDDSFYQRWILGDSFEQTEESNWTIRFKQTALDIFPMFSQAKLKAESLFPLFVHLAANRFTCNAQDMVGIIKNSFDPSILLKDITNATNIIEKEAQKVALRLQPGRTSLVDNFAVLSNIIPLVGRHNFIQHEISGGSVFKCQIRDTQAAATVHPSEDLSYGGLVLLNELNTFNHLKNEYTIDLTSPQSDEDANIPAAPNQVEAND